MGKRSEGPVIAIDGPAASGKSTVAIRVADTLGLRLVDSGSMYRAVTLLALESGTSVDDEDGLVRLARDVRRDFRVERPAGGKPRIFLGQREITNEIRSTAVGEAVSPVSRFAGLRSEMVELQRDMARGGGAVLEGRDIGTTVMPDADLKVFLDATLAERVNRRHLELEDRGIHVPAEEVREEIESRDSIDSSRECSPLKPAGDAVIIDTTGLSIAEVVDAIISECRSRRLMS